MEVWLIHVIERFPVLVYGVITIVDSFTGPPIALVAGVLVKAGLLAFIPAYIALMLGDLIGDVWWYFVGHRFGHKFISRYGKYVSVTEQEVAVVQRIFDKYHSAIIVISKLTTGFGLAPVTLITAGLTGIPFKKYMILNIVGQIFWTAILLGIGFFLGSLYLKFDNFLGTMTITAFVVLGIVILFGFGKYLQKRLMEKFS